MDLDTMTDSVTTRRCGVPRTKGTPCGNPTLAWFEGAGWRCPFHMPEGAVWPRKEIVDSDRKSAASNVPPMPPPNDGVITDIASARGMIAWATQELSNRRLPESLARGVINGATRYIRAFESTEGSEQMSRIENGLRKAGFIKEA